MQNYKQVVKQILNKGELRPCRNGFTTYLPGTTIKFDAKDIPLLNGRKMFIKGIVGEFAALMRNPKHVDEFKDFGCNYWGLWADEEGKLEVDYSEQLFNFNGVNQLEELKKGLRKDPYSRRHIINLWRPDRLDKLSLPCCHFSYQFIVGANNQLNMIWTQRSADFMIGVPSDMILAYLWVQCLSKELGFTPGEVTMNFGDSHIYEEHMQLAYDYVERSEPKLKPLAHIADEFTTIETFLPEMLIVTQYDPHPAISFELKA